MNKDDIIAMAIKSHLVMADYDHPSLKAFAALVAAAEREACAKVCDAEAERKEADGTWLWEARRCAAAIRARSNT